MNEIDKTNLPKEWQEVDHYSLRMGWLHNNPKPSQLELQEQLEKDGKDISIEITGHPGWWLHANVMMDSFESLQDALGAAKSVLKNSDFKPSVLNFDEPVSGVPVRFSKSQRVKLIDEIMHEPKTPHEGLVREAFLQEGDYALSVWIEQLSFREDFEAEFSTPENPLRSLVGKMAVVHTTPLLADDEDELDLGDFEADDEPDMEDLSQEEMVELLSALEKMREQDEDDDEDDLEDDEDSDEIEVEDGDNDWKEVAKGVVRLEGNTLYVGEWQCDIKNDELIYGAAFQSASFDLEDQGLSVLVEMENSHE